jgi:peptide/nickel transport system ATP-binding protein
VVPADQSEQYGATSRCPWWTCRFVSTSGGCSRTCARDGLAKLYITHDIASARYFADEITVIYAARMVEGGPAEEVTQLPRHPYTQLLLESSSDPDRDGERRTLPIVDASNEPLDREQELAGCPFAARWPHAMPVCSEQPPPTTTTAANGPWAQCWLND